jgi:hypothetical protein
MRGYLFLPSLLLATVLCYLPTYGSTDVAPAPIVSPLEESESGAIVEVGAFLEEFQRRFEIPPAPPMSVGTDPLLTPQTRLCILPTRPLPNDHVVQSTKDSAGKRLGGCTVGAIPGFADADLLAY